MVYVSPSIFGRLVSGGGQGIGDDPDGSKQSNQDSSAPETVGEPALFQDVVAAWREELADVMRQDLADHPLSQLNLEGPHPGGLAQLYAEHPTKLSNLYRDEFQRQRSRVAAVSLLQEAQRLLNRYGLVTLYLSIGTASWDEGLAEAQSAVLLRPIEVTMDSSGEVYLSLRPGIEISNRLLMVLSRHGSPLGTDEILQSVRSRFGFSPERALQLVREAGASIPGFKVADTLSVGVFSHPTSALLRELGAPQWLSLSVPVRALAGMEGAASELEFTVPDPNPQDRDPWEEVGLGSVSPQVADTLEVASGSESVLVEVPSQADLISTASAVAAEHAARGSSVLVVASPGVLQSGIYEELESAGASGIANVVGSTGRSAKQVQEALNHALFDASDDFDVDGTDQMRTKLRRRREELSSYTQSLHQNFEPWGASAFDALQVLTDLTSIPGGPSTRVRLGRGALTALAADRGEAARSLLQQAENLGLFSGEALRNWWTGVEILDDQSVDTVLGAVRELSETVLPKTEADMQQISAETGLQLASTVAEWNRELDVLRGVQNTLDVFVPRVFERSAADMVVATASKDWRKSRGIKLGWRQRRRLVKQAKDLQVLGAHVPDLHAELVRVQERRESWRKLALKDSWPVVPVDLASVFSVQQELQSRLELLNPYLSPVYGDLFELSMEELGGLMDVLAGDPQGARELPKRVRVVGQLDALGLSDLVADLQVRNVAGDALGWELDLAWWASALSLMLADDPRLGGIDPTGLQLSLDDLGRLERLQAASLGPQVRSRVMRHRQQALAELGEGFERARQQLETPMSAPAYYAQVPLSWDLMPIVITAPALVPQVVPWGRHVDVVILAGLPDLALPGLVPLIARGQQVVVLAESGDESAAATALKQTFTGVSLAAQPQNVNGSVVELLSRYDAGSAAVAVPSRHPQGKLNLQLVAGTGMPAPGVHAIESSAAEVDAVVERVRAHAASDSDLSFAVVALNRRHAERIQAALRAAALKDGALAEYLSAEVTEPFVVVSADEADGIYRDRVLIAVGYAKTPHGRMIHDFGPYSQPGGEQLLANALGMSRTDLEVVASFSADDVDRDRVRSSGALMLVDLLELGAVGEPHDGTDWPTLEVAPDHLLVDLAERLYAKGLNVVPNLGVPGGLRIPLAIGHPEVPGELLVAVLTDDEDYISQPSSRVRDCLIPRMLEGQGWMVRIELSMAVFIDPNKETEAIVQLVLDAVDNFYEKNPHLAPHTDDLPEEQELITAQELGLVEPPEESELVEDLEQQELWEAEQEEIAVTGTNIILPKTGRPLIAAGLPLAAYGDDQLDEVAQWIMSVGEDLDDAEVAEQIRDFLALHRRGAQSDAVLGNVVRRNRSKADADE